MVSGKAQWLHQTPQAEAGSVWLCECQHLTVACPSLDTCSCTWMSMLGWHFLYSMHQTAKAECALFQCVRVHKCTGMHTHTAHKHTHTVARFSK